MAHSKPPYELPSLGPLSPEQRAYLQQEAQERLRRAAREESAAERARLCMEAAHVYTQGLGDFLNASHALLAAVEAWPEGADPALRRLQTLSSVNPDAQITANYVDALGRAGQWPAVATVLAQQASSAGTAEERAGLWLAAARALTGYKALASTRTTHLCAAAHEAAQPGVSISLAQEVLEEAEAGFARRPSDRKLSLATAQLLYSQGMAQRAHATLAQTAEALAPGAQRAAFALEAAQLSSERGAEPQESLGWYSLALDQDATLKEEVAVRLEWLIGQWAHDEAVIQRAVALFDHRQAPRQAFELLSYAAHRAPAELRCARSLSVAEYAERALDLETAFGSYLDFLEGEGRAQSSCDLGPFAQGLCRTALVVDEARRAHAVRCLSELKLWAALAQLHEDSAHLAPSDGLRARALYEAGQIYEGPLEDLKAAVRCYAEAFRLDRQQLHYPQAGERAYRRLGDWRMVDKLLSVQLRASPDNDQRRRLLLEQARVRLDHLGQALGAYEALRAALALEGTPESTQQLRTELVQLLEDGTRFDSIEESLRARAEREEGPARAQLYLELAALQGELRRRPQLAAEPLMAAADADPEDEALLVRVLVRLRATTPTPSIARWLLARAQGVPSMVLRRNIAEAAAEHFRVLGDESALAAALRIALAAQPHDETLFDAARAAAQQAGPSALAHFYRELAQSDRAMPEGQRLTLLEDWRQAAEAAQDQPGAALARQHIFELRPHSSEALEAHLADLLYAPEARLAAFDRHLKALKAAGLPQPVRLRWQVVHLALDTLDQPALAAALLRDMLAERPEDLTLRETLGQALLRMEDLPGCRALWAQTLEIAQTFAEREQAAEVLESLALQEPVDVAMLVLSREVLAEGGDVAALEALIDALERQGAHAPLRQALARRSALSEGALRLPWLRKEARLWTETGQWAEAVRCWAQVLQIDPQAQEALAALADLYERLGQHRELVDVLWRRHSALPPHEALPLLTRAAQLAEAALGAPQRALQLWQRVGEICEAGGLDALGGAGAIGAAQAADLLASGASPGPWAAQWAHSLEEQLRLAEIEGDWAALWRAGELRLRGLQGPQWLALVRRLARWAQGAAQMPERAGQWWAALLQADPQDMEALQAQVKLARRAQDTPALAQALSALSAQLLDPRRRAPLLAEEAQLRAALGEGTQARALWREALQVDPQLPGGREALLALAEAAGLAVLYEDLNALLRVPQPAPILLELSIRLGQVAAQIGEAERAIEAWERVISMTHSGSEVEQQALDAMEAIYLQTRQLSELRRLIAAQTARMAQPEQRAARLLDAAQTVEALLAQGADAEAPAQQQALQKTVLGWRYEAWRADPGSSAQQRDHLLALAEAAGRWDRVAAVLQQAAQREPAQARPFLERCLAVQIEQLRAPAQALKTALALLQEAPESDTYFEQLRALAAQVKDQATLYEGATLRARALEEAPRAWLFAAQVGRELGAPGPAVFEQFVRAAQLSLRAPPTAKDEEGGRSAEVGARSAEEGGRSAEVDGRAAEEGGRSAEEGARSAEERARSAEEGARSAEERARSAEVDGRAAEEGPQISAFALEVEAQLTAYAHQAQLKDEFVAWMHAQIDASPLGPARRARRLRLAHALEHTFQDARQALGQLAQGFLIEPAAPALWGPVQRLTTAQRAWPWLAELLQAQVQTAEAPERRAALLWRLAQIQREALGQPDAALQSLKQAFSARPGDAQVRAQLHTLSAQLGRLGWLARLFEEEAAWVGDQESRAGLYTSAAQILAQVGQPAQAVRLMERVLELRPQDDAAVAQLLGYAQDTRDAELWAQLLSQYADRGDLALRRARLAQLAQLYAHTLRSPERAGEAWWARVRLQPEDEESFDALVSFLESSEQWALLRDVLDERVALIQRPDWSGPAPYDELQLRMAELLHYRLGEVQAGFDRLALVAARHPEALGLLRTLARRAARADRAAVAAVQAERSAQVLTGRERIEALLYVGRIARDLMGDRERAREAFQQIVAADPGGIECARELDALLAEGGLHEARVALYHKVGPRICATSAQDYGSTALVERWALALADIEVRQLADAARAQQTVEALLAALPHSAHGWAWLWQLAERTRDGGALVRAAQALAPLTVETKAQLGVAAQPWRQAALSLAQMGEEAQAQRAWAQQLWAQPDDLEAHEALWRTAQRSESYDALAVQLAAVAQRQSDPLAAWLGVAQLQLDRRNDLWGARQALAWAAQADPQRAHVQVHLLRVQLAEALADRPMLDQLADRLLVWVEAQPKAERGRGQAEEEKVRALVATLFYERAQRQRARLPAQDWPDFLEAPRAQAWAERCAAQIDAGGALLDAKISPEALAEEALFLEMPAAGGLGASAAAPSFEEEARGFEAQALDFDAGDGLGDAALFDAGDGLGGAVLLNEDAALFDENAALFDEGDGLGGAVLLDEDDGLFDEDAGLFDADASQPDADAALFDEDAVLLDEDAGLFDADALQPDADAGLFDEDAVLLDEDAGLFDEDASQPDADAVLFDADASQPDAQAVLFDADASQPDAQAVLFDEDASQPDAQAVLFDADASQPDADAALFDAEGVLLSAGALENAPQHESRALLKRVVPAEAQALRDGAAPLPEELAARSDGGPLPAGEGSVLEEGFSLIEEEAILIEEEAILIAEGSVLEEGFSLIEEEAILIAEGSVLEEGFSLIEEEAYLEGAAPSEGDGSFIEAVLVDEGSVLIEAARADDEPAPRPRVVASGWAGPPQAPGEAEAAQAAPFFDFVEDSDFVEVEAIEEPAEGASGWGRAGADESAEAGAIEWVEADAIEEAPLGDFAAGEAIEWVEGGDAIDAQTRGPAQPGAGARSAHRSGEGGRSGEAATAQGAAEGAHAEDAPLSFEARLAYELRAVDPQQLEAAQRPAAEVQLQAPEAIDDSLGPQSAEAEHSWVADPLQRLVGWLEVAHRMAPRRREITEDYADALVDALQWTQAVELYRQIPSPRHKEGVERARSALRRAAAWLAVGQETPALRAYEWAGQWPEARPWALEAQAQLHERAGRVEAAVRHYQRLGEEAEAPEVRQRGYLRAARLVDERLNKAARAIGLYERAREVGAEDLHTLRRCFELSLALHRTAQARELAPSLWIHPDRAQLSEALQESLKALL